MSIRRTPGAACVLASVLACVILASSAEAGVSRLRRMVVVGDSLLAGFGSGGFVGAGRPGQVDSAPAFVARRAHVKLPLPLMSDPGVPAQLGIVDANRNGQLDPGEVRRQDSGLGFRDDPEARARNLAVPGEDMVSVFQTISPQDIAGQLVSGSPNGRDILKFLVLGLPLQSDPVSQLSRARDIAPSFLLVWLGNNDVLDMATNTNPGAATLGANDFGNRFRGLLDALADTRAGMAVANLPDPTGIAALRRAAGEVTSCHKADGTMQAVASDDLLSIDLDRSLLPTPPCGKVLDAAERAQVRATVIAFNAEIAAAIADTEQRRGVSIASVDTFAAFDQLQAAGVDLDGNGTPDLTTRYLGGIFSLDGIHPTRTGNAIIANAFIDAINARFGEAIPRVDVARVAARDRLAHSRFRPAGEPPFGLIGDGQSDDIESFFTHEFDNVQNGINDIRDKLEHRLGDFF